MTRVIAFDTETRGLNWFDPSERAFLLSWADEGGEYVADLSDGEQVRHALNVLNSADILVCHNAKFDLHQMQATLGWNGLSVAPVEDTDLISRVMYPAGQRENGGRGGHGLKQLGKTFIDPDAKDEEEAIEAMGNSIGVKLKGDNATKAAYWEVWKAYPDVMESYAKQDARLTYDLYVRFLGEMSKTQGRVYDLERRVLPVLYRAEHHGVALDPEPVQRLRKQYTAQLNEKADLLEKELGSEALGGKGSEAALIEALQSQGIPLYRTTDGGQLSTSHSSLAEFEAEFPVIQHLFDYRRAKKFLSTYIEPMVGRDVVHTSFAQYQAWTGRMASYSPNMQNIPKSAGKEVRSMFVPRPGHVFLVFDYDSIEARLLAYYLGDAGYRQLFNDGHDPHAWMASQIWGGSMDQYRKGTDGQPQRTDAKEVTYAICYGAGGPRVTDILGLDPGPFWGPEHPTIVAARAEGKDWPREGYQYRQARGLISNVKGHLPNFNRLNRRIRNKIEDVGCVHTLWGRQQIVPKDKSYVGLNALIQGSAADIMKQGLINVDEAVRDLGAIPLLVVHDEVVVECPEEHAQECYARMEAALCEAYDLNPRLEVEGSIFNTNYAES